AGRVTPTHTRLATSPCARSQRAARADHSLPPAPPDLGPRAPQSHAPPPDTSVKARKYLPHDHTPAPTRPPWPERRGPAPDPPPPRVGLPAAVGDWPTSHWAPPSGAGAPARHIADPDHVLRCLEKGGSRREALLG